MVAIAVAVTASAAYLFRTVGKELVPDDDQSEFSVNVRLPRGNQLRAHQEYVAPDRTRNRALGPEVESR